MFNLQGRGKHVRLLLLFLPLVLAGCSDEKDNKPRPHTFSWEITANSEGDGSIKPKGPIKVSSSGSVTFTATPSPGWKIAGLNSTGARNCLYPYSDFYADTENGKFTVSKPIRDCEFTVIFEKITLSVNADVAIGSLQALKPASVATSIQPHFFALDVGKNQAYIAQANGANSKINIHSIANGVLSSTAAKSITTPYIKEPCKNTTGAAYSSECLVVGPQGSNAKNYVYVMLDKKCSTSGACIDTPSIRIYKSTAGNLTLVEDKDLSSDFSYPLTQVTSMAISPTNNNFAAVSAQLIDNGDVINLLVLYKIASNGKLTLIDILASETLTLGAVTFAPNGADIYVAYHSVEDAGSESAGIIHALVKQEAGQTSLAGDGYTFGITDAVSAKVNDFVITPDGSQAYLASTAIDNNASQVIELITLSFDSVGVIDKLSEGAFEQLYDSDYSSVDDVTLHPFNDNSTVYVDLASSSEGNNTFTVYHIGEQGVWTQTKRTTTFEDGLLRHLTIAPSNDYAYVNNGQANSIEQFALGTDNGTATPATQTVEYGESATISIVPANKYQAIATDNGCNGVLNSNTNAYNIANIINDCDVSISFIRE